jgi:hypothetical protein
MAAINLAEMTDCERLGVAKHPKHPMAMQLMSTL